jgi:hypothetical protein
MNRVTVELQIEDLDLQQEPGEIAALTVDQLLLISGGECVVNSI